MDPNDPTQSSHHFLSGKKIIIAGAGISGLTFAIALRKQWLNLDPTTPQPSITIYERDLEEFVMGREGYSLSLRTDSPTEGLQTVQKLSLLDAMIEESVTGLNHEGGFTMWDKDWKPFIRIKPRSPQGLPIGAMRIIRSKLRSVLVKGAANYGDEVQWGIAVTSVKGLEDGRMEVTLSNGTAEECDLLIAPDGANSRIQSQLRPDDTLQFAGYCMFSGVAHFEHSPSPSLIGKDWGILVSGLGTAVFTSPQDSNSITWSLSYASKEPRPKTKQPIPETDIESILAEVREYGKVIPSLFGQLLDKTDFSTLMVASANDKQPFTHDLSQGNDIFLGDANHAVTPFSGSGANVAIMDGWDLPEQLLKSSSLAEAIKKYDSISVPRSKTVLQRSHFNISVGHSKGWRTTMYTLLLKTIQYLFLGGTIKGEK